jgi:hypothetical protein
MRFSGRLQIEADPHNWLKADLMVARGRVELVSGSELLGSWSTSQVVAERVEADRFSLQLGDDRALFIADDALSFSYEAMPQLNKRQLLPVGGVMDKLKAGLRGDDNREPAVVAEPAAVPPSESAVATTGKRLRELIREASGYATPAPVEEKANESAVEMKGGHTLDAVLRRRSGAKDDSHIASELKVERDSELSTDDLLERLFDDAPDHDLLRDSSHDRNPGERQSYDDQSITGSLWAEPITVTEPASIPRPATDLTPVAAPAVPEPPASVPAVVEAPVAAPPPAVETWQKEQPPLEVWHKTDLSANPDPQWGSSQLAADPISSPFGNSTWPSSFEAEPRSSEADDVVAALKLIVADVKSGALSTEQVEAVSSLIGAIAQALQLKL